MLIFKKIKGVILLLTILAGISLAAYLTVTLVGYGKMKALFQVSKVTVAETERQGGRASDLATVNIEKAKSITRTIIYVEQNKSKSANTCMPDDIARSHGWLRGCTDRSIVKEGKRAVK